MRRTTWRTSSSAVAVTVQVFSTTKSASCTSFTAASPFAASPASIAAPSACEALHPKFLTRKRSTQVKCSLPRKRYTDPGTRMKKTLFGIALGLCAFALFAQNKRAEMPPWDDNRMDMQAPPPQGVAVRAGRMFDPKSGTNLTNQVILIKGDRILDVGPADKTQIPQGATVID